MLVLFGSAEVDLRPPFLVLITIRSCHDVEKARVALIARACSGGGTHADSEAQPMGMHRFHRYRGSVGELVSLLADPSTVPRQRTGTASEQIFLDLLGVLAQCLLFSQWLRLDIVPDN